MASFIGYGRVSRIGERDVDSDSFQAIRQQTELISGWAGVHGHQLIDVVTEVDVPGSRAAGDRRLGEVLTRIEAGEATGLVVARLDRFARSLHHGLAAIDRLHRSGGMFVAVQDGFDLSTPTGRFTLHVMLSLGELELERIRATFKASKTDAVRRGLTVGSVAPFGYRRPGGGRPLEIVKNEARLARGIFERRARGEGWSRIAGWLHAEAAVTRYGSKRWANRALRDIVRNRVYVGEARAVVDRSTGETVVTAGAHPAIVDEGLWRQANAVTGPAFTPRAGSEEDRSILRGLLRCAGCRGAMRWEMRSFATGPEWLVSCRNAGGGDTSRGCPEPASTRRIGEVEEEVARMVLDALPQMRAESANPDDVVLDGERALAEAVEARDQWRDDVALQRAVGMSQYVAGLEHRQRGVDEAERTLARARGAGLAQLVAFRVEDEWEDMTTVERAEILEALLTCIMVRGGRQGSGGIRERLRLIWRGEPIDLPTRGRRNAEVLAPFRW